SPSPGNRDVNFGEDGDDARGGSPGKNRGVSPPAIAATATGSANTHRHEVQATMNPETTTPETAPIPASPPHTAAARARRAGSGQSAPSNESAAGAVSAAPPPWARRAPIRAPAPDARPATSDAAPKRLRPTVKIRFRPSRSDKRPPTRRRPPKVRP